MTDDLKALLPSWEEYQNLMSAGYAMKARAEKAEANIEHWRQEVGKLHSKVDRLTRERDAATAAAYEAAAQTCDNVTNNNDFTRDIRRTSSYCAERIRALATPDQTAALDRVRAEAKAEGMRAAADLLRGQGYNTAVREILAAIPKEGA